MLIEGRDVPDPNSSAEASRHYGPACGYGWCRDLADFRDYSLENDVVARMLSRITRPGRKASLPHYVDWREYCGPVEDDQGLNTSAAHACVALIQHLERRSSGRLVRLSRLFLHQVARRMAGVGSNSAISLRTVLKAAVHCGIPPERYVPYDLASFESIPEPFAYSFQRGFRTLRYLRLDGPQSSADEVLQRLRLFLAGGFSIAFGFTVHSSIAHDADIAFPTRQDTVVGGQAVTAVGFDDRLRIRSDKGALLIRNSWGHSWGDGGYGWLPYAYVTERLAVDFWTFLKPSWLRSGEFELFA